jgi:hypothetical protein
MSPASSSATTIADAEAAAHAGACAVVLECVPQEVAATITRSIAVPTIGIGAGPHCDGQVLVMHDLIGLSTGRVPRFVRAYAGVKASISDALARWRDDVEHRIRCVREAGEPRVRERPLRQRGGRTGWCAQMLRKEGGHLRHVIDARAGRKAARRIIVACFWTR